MYTSKGTDWSVLFTALLPAWKNSAWHVVGDQYLLNKEINKAFVEYLYMPIHVLVLGSSGTNPVLSL